jgi:hypothetical protein
MNKMSPCNQKMGYFSMVADIYGSGKYPSNKREAGEIATYYKTQTSQYRHRINLALQELLKQEPMRITLLLSDIALEERELWKRQDPTCQWKVLSHFMADCAEMICMR